MSTKHSSGPWSVIEHNWSDTGVTSENEYICLLKIYEGDEARADSVAANARLIAAAPELLDTLSRVMSWIDNWSPSFTEDDEWPADRDAALAAITKATGGAA